GGGAGGGGARWRARALVWATGATVPAWVVPPGQPTLALPLGHTRALVVGHLGVRRVAHLAVRLPTTGLVFPRSTGPFPGLVRTRRPGVGRVSTVRLRAPRRVRLLRGPAHGVHALVRM